MRFGCCLPGVSFVSQMNGPKNYGVQSVIKNIADVFCAGFDFAEMTVGSITGMSDEEYTGFTSFLNSDNLVIEAFNSFVPPSIPLVGPSVCLASIENHIELTARRVSGCGGKTVVFGSGAARRIPDGITENEAKSQITGFLRLCGEVFKTCGITLCIEPLNTMETNNITSVSQGARLCAEANHPNIMLLADCYHMHAESEDFGELKKAAPLLRHVHVSDAQRIPPGFPCENGVDFTEFFKMLKDIGYAYAISAECPFESIIPQAGESLKYLKKAWEQA